MTEFRVERIDHVEVFVPERYEAAEWYRRVLGLEIVRDFEFWADDLRGPLMITSGSGTKVALFEGSAQGDREVVGFIRLAFLAGCAAFVDFVSKVSSLELRDAQGRAVGPADVVDHKSAYSIYFSDPYGNPLEITTYDYEEVAAALAASE